MFRQTDMDWQRKKNNDKRPIVTKLNKTISVGFK